MFSISARRLENLDFEKSRIKLRVFWRLKSTELWQKRGRKWYFALYSVRKQLKSTFWYEKPTICYPKSRFSKRLLWAVTLPTDHAIDWFVGKYQRNAMLLTGWSENLEFENVRVNFRAFWRLKVTELYQKWFLNFFFGRLNNQNQLKFTF